MSAVTQFQIHENHFEGALPASGLQVLRGVSNFSICTNGFKGALPEGGIRSMSTADITINVGH
eukprot:5420388-Amphidinium_carterae.1